jgi:hypothetical protein
VAASHPIHRSSFLRFIVIGVAGLGILAFIGGKFFSQKKDGQAVVMPLATPPTAANTSPAPRAVLASGPASSVSATLPAAVNASQILNASREELLAITQDMLAKGRPLEDVIALLDYLAASKPEFAIDLARDIGRSDGERHVLLLAVLSDWAHADAASALQWAFQKSNQYNVPSNASLFYVVLEQVAADDPQTALASAEVALKQPSSLTSGASASEVARLTLEALTKTGQTDLARQAVDGWARGPEAANLDGAVYEVVAMSLAQNSAEDAANWLSSLPSSPARSQSLLTIETVWVQSNPQAAIEWAQGLPQADGREDAIAQVLSHWAGQDRAAATQWASEHGVFLNSGQ